MHLRESEKQVVANTLVFFAEDPKRRAIDENGCCLMRTHDGRQCAIGRHIPMKMHNDFGGLLFHAGHAYEMWACPDLLSAEDCEALISVGLQRAAGTCTIASQLHTTMLLASR